MSKNLIPVIADCLGVRIGEEFDVNIPYMGKTRGCRYKLTKQGLVRKRETGEWASAAGFLEGLICGDYEIIKLPFEPKAQQEVWIYFDVNWRITWMKWLYEPSQIAMLKLGCVFRTKEEAIAARPAKYKELTGKEWKENDRT